MSTFEPTIYWRALASKVLVVAATREIGEWAAYCDVVPGERHSEEYLPVLYHGCKLPEPVARVLFPEFTYLPYAL